jgi:hypothetical protein
MVYMLYLNGAKNYDFSSQVLSKQYTVSTTRNIAEDISYVDRIFTTSTMISSEGIPSNLHSALLPSYAVEKTVTLPGSVGTGRLTWYASWKKTAFEYQNISSTKAQVAVEYEYGLYLPFLSGGNPL